MTQLTIELSDEDLGVLDSLVTRFGFTSREAAASAALHLALPAIEQASGDNAQAAQPSTEPTGAAGLK